MPGTGDKDQMYFLKKKKKKIYFYLLIYLAVLGLSEFFTCGMWDLVL